MRSRSRRPRTRRAARATAPHRPRKAGAAALDLFNRLNDERQARGLAPLTWDPYLSAYAADWSRTMGTSDMHHSNIGKLLGPYNYVGENIAMGSAGVPASALHVNWMHSQGHRDNILAPGLPTGRGRRVLRAQRVDLGDRGLRPARQLRLAAAVRGEHAGQPGRAAGRRSPGLLASQAQILGPVRSRRHTGDGGPKVAAA